MTDTERKLTERVAQLEAENDRLKAWNRKFYGLVHYYFMECLEPWKQAAPYSEQKRKLTAKCRSKETQIAAELCRIDNNLSKRGTDLPADADKPTAVQLDLGIN